MNTTKKTTKKPQKSNVKVVALSFSDEGEFSSTSYMFLKKLESNKKQYSAKAAIDAIASQLYAVFKTLKQTARDRVCSCIKDLNVADEILQTFLYCPMCSNKNQTSGVPEFMTWLYSLHAMNVCNFYALTEELEQPVDDFLELGNVSDVLKLSCDNVAELDENADWVLVGSLIYQGIMSKPNESKGYDDHDDLKLSCIDAYEAACHKFAR